MSTSSYVLISNKVTMLANNSMESLFGGISLEAITYTTAILAVIILIIGIITLGVAIKTNNKLKSNQGTSFNQNTVPVIQSTGNQNLVADTELVAVITAAIYASMGDQVPSGGLVVRSIHKVNTKR